MRARWRAVVWRKDGKAAAAWEMAESTSSLAHSGHVPMTLPVEGSVGGRLVFASMLLEGLHAVDFKDLARLCFNPFPIDINDVLLEKGRVVELAVIVSGEGRLSGTRAYRWDVLIRHCVCSGYESGQ